MSRGVIALAVLFGCLGCGTRIVVVNPADVSKLNDPQWTIKAVPAADKR
jgi:hypothetical protein